MPKLTTNSGLKNIKFIYRVKSSKWNSMLRKERENTILMHDSLMHCDTIIYNWDYKDQFDLEHRCNKIYKCINIFGLNTFC